MAENKENAVKQFASLDDLLKVNPDDKVEGEVTVQLRNGSYITLPITSVDPEVEKSIRKKSTSYTSDRFGRHAVMDDLKYNCMLIDAATDKSRTSIRWNSKELQEQFGLPTPAPILIVPKVLSLGGIGKAASAIVELSGLDDSFEEGVEAAKN